MASRLSAVIDRRRKRKPIEKSVRKSVFKTLASSKPEEGRDSLMANR